MFRRIAGKIDPKVKAYIPNPSGPTPTPAAYTKLLMHFDTDFSDDAGHTASNTGVVIDTASKVFGAGSADFGDGAGNNLDFLYSADFAFADGDFTIDFRMKLKYTAGSYHNCIFQNGSGGCGWGINFQDGSQINFVYSSTGASFDNVVHASFSFTEDTWYMIKVAVISGLCYLFVDGICLNPGGTALTSAIFDPGADTIIGKDPLGADMEGSLDELRILKGLGDASSDFTPPSTPYVVV